MSRVDTSPRVAVDTVTLEKTKSETMARLRTLELKIQKKVLRKGARAGGMVLKKAVRAAAPKVNKTLDRSIDLKIKTYPSGNIAGVIGQDLRKQPKKSKAKKPRVRKGGGLSAQGKTVPDHFVALRTKAHPVGTGTGSIALYSGKRLKWRTQAGFRYAFGIRHRGTKGNDFLERGFLAGRKEADRVTEAKISVEIDAETNNLQGTAN